MGAILYLWVLKLDIGNMCFRNMQILLEGVCVCEVLKGMLKIPVILILQLFMNLKFRDNKANVPEI